MKHKLKTKLQFEFEEVEFPEINYDLNLTSNKIKPIKIIEKKKGKFKYDASTRLF